MREHQIVITLKPEQFQEIQKLSRAAGAKSMGMFVRQQLLIALGIESNKSPQPSTAGGADMKRIVAELRQLHGELRAFVADSLGKDYSLAAGQPEPVGQSNPVSSPEGTEIASTADSEPSAMQTVGQTPALMPGCIEEFGGGLHPGQTDLKDPARKGGVSVERDELEQIAQRAFAISPRLGAMEGPADKVKGSDPLEELLAEASTSSPGKAEQQAEEISDVEPEAEEIFDVSLPLKEKSGRSTAYQMDEKNQGQPKDKLSPPGKQTPGTTGPPFSGGPPPRRRQS